MNLIYFSLLSAGHRWGKPGPEKLVRILMLLLCCRESSSLVILVTQPNLDQGLGS